MTNCEVCDQELIHGEFEENLGICVNCILIDSREDSFKSLLIIFLIIIGWVVYITSFFPVIFILAFLNISFEEFFFLFPPLIVLAFIGPGLIYLTVFYKFK